MVRSGGTRTSNHLRPRTAPDGASKGNFWGTSRLERSGNSPSKAKGLRTTKSGAGVGSPRGVVGGTRTHDPTPPRRGATHNSPLFGDNYRIGPSARGKRNCRGVFEARTPTPNAAEPRPLASRAKRGYPDCIAIARRARQRGEQRLSLGLRGTLLAQRPNGRGSAGEEVIFSVVLKRDWEPRNPLSFRFPFAFNFPPPPFSAAFCSAFPPPPTTNQPPTNKPVLLSRLFNRFFNRTHL